MSDEAEALTIDGVTFSAAVPKRIVHEVVVFVELDEEDSRNYDPAALYAELTLTAAAVAATVKKNVVRPEHNSRWDFTSTVRAGASGTAVVAAEAAS